MKAAVHQEPKPAFRLGFVMGRGGLRVIGLFRVVCGEIAADRAGKVAGPVRLPGKLGAAISASTLVYADAVAFGDNPISTGFRDSKSFLKNSKISPENCRLGGWTEGCEDKHQKKIAEEGRWAGFNDRHTRFVFVKADVLPNGFLQVPYTKGIRHQPANFQLRISSRLPGLWPGVWSGWDPPHADWDKSFWSRLG